MLEVELEEEKNSSIHIGSWGFVSPYSAEAAWFETKTIGETLNR